MFNDTRRFPRHLLLLAIGVIAAIGCDARSDSGPSNPTTLTQASLPVDTARHASEQGPVAVVELFSYWDSAGHWTCIQCDPRYAAAYAELSCSAGDPECDLLDGSGDLVWVTSGQRIRTVVEAADSALIEVRYDLVAGFSGGHVVPPDSAARSWRFRLRRDQGRWRIDGASLGKPPAVSVAFALSRLLTDSAEATSLRRLTER